MKSISTSAYQNLTPAQRIRAAVSAVARGDEDEARKLRETCPKRTYRTNDLEFAGRMESLMSLALAVECDQRGLAVTFWQARAQAVRIAPEDKGELFDAADRVVDALREMASIDRAWREFLESLGVDPDDMSKTGPPSPPEVEAVVELAREPSDPCPELVSEFRRSMEESLDPDA